MKNVKEVTAEVTNALMALVKDGTIPWQKGWLSIVAGYISLATDPKTGQNYSLGGAFNSLMYRINELRYGSRVFCNETMKKIHGLVPKDGEKPFIIFHPIFRNEDRVDDDGKKTVVKVMVGFSTKPMWCCGQFSNWAEKRKSLLKVENVKRFMWKPNASAEAFGQKLIEVLGVAFHQGEEENPSFDTQAGKVNLPCREQFVNEGEYYIALFHEISHATRHGMKNKGAYAFEEIVVEAAAAIICQLFGINYDVSNTAAYVSSWSKRFDECAKEGTLVKCFGQAGELVKLLLEKGGESVEE